MSAKYVFALLMLCASMVSGCYRSVRLYPVQGPMAVTAPPQILAAKITGVFNSGNMSVTLPGGEICKGGWNLVSRAPTQNSLPVNTTPTASLAPAWDTVYGQGFYTAHVLGTRLRVSGTLTGNKGTTLNVDLYRPDTPDGPNEVKGVAIDNHGNVYKIAL